MAHYARSSLKLNHTCLRVKDPKLSIPFYEKNFGLKLISHKKLPEFKFDLYFLAFSKENHTNPFNIEGVLELTHNYGTELDPDYKINNGNEEPHRGFGHICFSVEDIKKSQDELLANNCQFKKRLEDGRQRDIAFVLDPDGYWIELIEHGKEEQHKFNHSMIRVKDPVKSLKFYREVLGMKLLSTSEHPNAKFTLYFLGYHHDDEFTENSLVRKEQANLQSVLELTWNWGTETEEDFKYHNGNEQPQGYGHIGISLDKPGEFCKELEEKFGDELTWGLKYNQGKMKNIAFIRDPDNYAIEILPETYDFE